jgi:hypothetical protein
VLAIVDGFAAGFIRSGPAAQKRSGFQESNPMPFSAQRRSRGKSGESAADDQNVHYLCRSGDAPTPSASAAATPAVAVKSLPCKVQHEGDK